MHLLSLPSMYIFNWFLNLFPKANPQLWEGREQTRITPTAETRETSYKTPPPDDKRDPQPYQSDPGVSNAFLNDDNSPVVMNPLNVSPANLIMSNELATQGSTGHKDPVHNQQQNADQLQERLKDVRIECYYQLWTYFIPLNKQEELITTPVIENEIRREDVKGECQDPKACAIWTNEHAKQLFTILSYLGKGGSWIHRMYRDGVSDDDLPLVPEKQGNRVVRLRRKSDKGVIPTFDTWRDGDLEEFVRLQWWVLVPRFDMHNLKCQEFREETVLPLMEAKSKGALDEVIPQMKLAGFSTVTAYQIHSAHHNFWSLCSIPEDEQPRVAIKTLLDTDNEEEYEKERSILEKLGPYNHRHLIKLLSTYRLKKQYSFIFPCAQANLRNFWEMRKQPTFDKVTLLWSITQMYGLASALELIHNFKTTIDLKPPGGVLLDDNLKIKVKKGEEKFGRHGDIKPENILWFKEAWENEEARKSKEVDMMGILKITDLGLGRFHGRESRSNVDPKTVNATPTYEPPECKLEKPVSRAYDIWSMACLYLEFVTWLLEGPEAIHDFADARGQRREALLTIDDRIYTIVRDPIINDDNFFTILRDENNARSAVIREAVVEWVERLHTHRNCSKAIHELLDLTMNHLLRPYSDQRIDSSSLKIEMRNILEKAKFNPDYLEPRPHESLRLSPSAATSQNNPPRRSVREQIPVVSKEFTPIPNWRFDNVTESAIISVSKFFMKLAPVAIMPMDQDYAQIWNTYLCPPTDRQTKALSADLALFITATNRSYYSIRFILDSL